MMKPYAEIIPMEKLITHIAPVCATLKKDGITVVYLGDHGSTHLYHTQVKIRSMEIAADVPFMKVSFNEGPQNKQIGEVQFTGHITLVYNNSTVDHDVSNYGIMWGLRYTL